MKRATIALAAFAVIIILSVFSALALESAALRQTYTVQKGDTLFSIGRKFAVPVERLKTANSLLSDLIFPGRRLQIPSLGEGGTLNSRFVLGFYVDKEPNQPCSYERMLANSSQISAVAPFWYRLAPDSPTELQVQHTADDTSPADLKDIIGAARQNNMQMYALVHNLLYPGQVDGAGLAAKMLATAATRNMFIDRLEGLIKEYGYDGINLDIERINLSDRERFSLLVKELYQRLEPQGFKVSVCVPAKTHDSITNSWSGPFDYREIGRYAHYVIIMTYDEHGYSSGPGPIASSGWVRAVTKYAAENISPEKILLGIPGYGFDWTVGQQAPRYISFAQAVALAASQGAGISWDNEGEVPYFRYRHGYGQDHQVWFENASSLTHKLHIVEEFNLKGIALWRLGMEDPDIWGVLNSKIKAEKK